MSFRNTSSDFDDFARFFYDQVSFRTDFFEEPNPKIDILLTFSNNMKNILIKKDFVKLQLQ